MEVVRVENLTKIYGRGDAQTLALVDANLSVQKGECSPAGDILVRTFMYGILRKLGPEDMLKLVPTVSALASKQLH